MRPVFLSPTTIRKRTGTARRPFAFGMCLCASVAIAGCDAGESDRPPAAEPATAASHAPVQIDACALLAEIGPATVLGEPADTAIPILKLGNAERAVSQCLHQAASSDRSVSLMIRYSARERNPRSKHDLMASEQAANIMGMGEDVAAAIRAGADVPNLGDVAFTYEMAGFNLYVLWQQHYQMVVTISGLAGDAALDRARSVASHVLKRYG